MKQTSISPGESRAPLPPPLIQLSSDPLLTAREAAFYRRQGLSTFWRDVKEGSVRRPIYVSSKAPRWHLSWLGGSSTQVVTDAGNSLQPGSDSARRATQ